MNSVKAAIERLSLLKCHLLKCCYNHLKSHKDLTFYKCMLFYGMVNETLFFFYEISFS